MRSRSVHLKAIVAAVLGLGAALAFASPAAAAGEVELSNDGVTYSGALATPLFTPAPVLVPAESASSVFWVRNGGGVAAYLRVTLTSATWGSTDYASSLLVSASVPSRSGTAVSLASTPVCSIMLRNVLLAPGEEVAVTTTVAMADLAGASGQASWAAFNLGVTLTEAAGLAASPDCSTPTTPVVVVRPPAGAPGSDVEPEPTPEPTAEPTPEPEPESPIDDFIAVLTNTLSLFDSSVLTAASASIPAGAALFFIVGRTRRALEKYREEGEQ